MLGLEEVVGLLEDVVAFLVEELLETFLLDEVLRIFLADEALVCLDDVLVFLLDVLEILTEVLVFLVDTGFMVEVLVFLEDVLDFLREEELDFEADRDTYLMVVWLVALEEDTTLLTEDPPATRVGD